LVRRIAAAEARTRVRDGGGSTVSGKTEDRSADQRKRRDLLIRAAIRPTSPLLPLSLSNTATPSLFQPLLPAALAVPGFDALAAAAAAAYHDMPATSLSISATSLASLADAAAEAVPAQTARAVLLRTSGVLERRQRQPVVGGAAPVSGVRVRGVSVRPPTLPLLQLPTLPGSLTEERFPPLVWEDARKAAGFGRGVKVSFDLGPKKPPSATVSWKSWTETLLLSRNLESCIFCNHFLAAAFSFRQYQIVAVF
jgi:hypothetical protein